MRTEHLSTLLGKMPTIGPIQTTTAGHVIVDEAGHPPPGNGGAKWRRHRPIRESHLADRNRCVRLDRAPMHPIFRSPSHRSEEMNSHFVATVVYAVWHVREQSKLEQRVGDAHLAGMQA